MFWKNTVEGHLAVTALDLSGELSDLKIKTIKNEDKIIKMMVKKINRYDFERKKCF